MAEKYLVGVDGSVPSRAALDWGLQRAAQTGAQVELLHVADDSFLSESVAFLNEAQQASEQMLAAEIAYAKTSGYTGDIIGTAVVGHPIFEMEEASKRADLVVLGAHSGNKFTGSFFGTRGVKIAAVSHCPVAVIPLAAPERLPAAVVVGVDGSDAAKQAVAFAAEEASSRGVPLIAVYAWMPPLTPGLEYLWSEELVESQRVSAEEAIAIGVAGLAGRYPDLILKRRIVQAPPVTALLQAAEEADTIVVGSRGRSGFTRLLLGSVSHGLLQSPSRTTIVTRAPVRSASAS